MNYGYKQIDDSTRNAQGISILAKEYKLVDLLCYKSQKLIETLNINELTINLYTAPIHLALPN